jgi:hypothetical protein
LGSGLRAAKGAKGLTRDFDAVGLLIGKPALPPSTMIHYVVAFALLLHVLFWGAGAAMLVMPWPWRRLWPVLIVPVGFALQSAVVWVAAHAGLRGTQTYAWWSELVPLSLLVAGVWCSGRRKAFVWGAGGAQQPVMPNPRGGWGDALRATWIDVSRFGLLFAATAGCLALLLLPIAFASRGLTTMSLGSCDAADYAAGARVLMEFARGDREGFLGLTEVVRVASVDNFFDYWLRLNHFTPSALIALNGTILDCAPHELTTLFVAVLFAGTLPVVFWSARAIVGYSGGVSLIIAGLFGVSPIMWYVVAHVSPAQLLAAQAVVVLTWAGVTLWRLRLSWRRGCAFAAVLATGFWLILGSYNFFLLLCLVPVATYVGIQTVWQRSWSRLGQWLAVMLLPLAGTAAIFHGRVAGLAERFTLLKEYDFGWQIPAFTAEGWLGMVTGPDLGPWHWFGVRWLLCAGVVALLGWAILRAIRDRRRAVVLVLAIIVPVLAGYLFLQARGARLGTNASYDAYKLFAVFYPLTLPAFCWWVTLRRSRKLHEWLFVASVAAVVVAFNVVGCAMFLWKMSRPPLIVDGELRQLRKIEAMADVKSVNMRIPDMWSRLWANAFLLRKRQYFPTHTYEGRLNTGLQGDWDLEGDLPAVYLGPEGRRQVSPRVAIVDTRHPEFVRVELGEGWHPEEFIPGQGVRWRWTSGDATLLVDNPHDYPLGINSTIDGWSAIPRSVALVRHGGEPRPAAQIGTSRGMVPLRALGLPPGLSTIVLRLDPPAAPVPGDPRPLGIAVFRLNIRPSR